jgi:PAS domain S-box-containing protein
LQNELIVGKNGEQVIRALYVDDDNILLKIFRMYMEREGGYSIDTAESAEEGLALFLKNKPDIIISDYQMPGMDGIAFLKEFRSQDPETPFILFTGKGREEIVIAAIENGADFYLQKGSDYPSQFAELDQKIRHAIGRRKAERSLRESEEKFRALIQNSFDIVHILDGEGKIVFETSSTERVLGYPPGFMPGKTVFDFIHPDDRARVREDLGEVIGNTNPNIPTEFRVQKADGDYIWVESVGKNCFDVPGIHGLVINTRPIGDRKKSELLLRSQLNLSRAIMAARDVTTVLDTCLCAAMEISGLDSGGIYLFDPVTGSADLVLSKNLGDTFVAAVAHYPADAPNMKTVLAGNPFYLSIGLNGIVPGDIRDNEGIRALAVIPIRDEKNVIGCMNVGSHQFNEIPADARIALETISGQIGNAIVRVRAEQALLDNQL